MRARRTLIAGNWKMNGGLAEARLRAAAALEAARGVEHEVALFPPFPWLLPVAAVLGLPAGPVALGGQCCHPAAEGAHTGSVSAAMLREAGCRYVLCGHSERRHLAGETDAEVAASLARALAEGLTPVLCVGESLAERDGGRARAVVWRQLDAGLDALEGPRSPLVVAYEPVWAIGTGRTATPEQASEAHGWIRARVAAGDPDRAAGLRILYGGSVTAGNIDGLLAGADVDGALVGGASLDPVAFARIVRGRAGGA